MSRVDSDTSSIEMDEVTDLSSPIHEVQPQPASACHVMMLLLGLLGVAILTSGLIFLIPHPHPHSVLHSGLSALAPAASGFLLPLSHHPQSRATTALQAAPPRLQGPRRDLGNGMGEETWAFDVGASKGPLLQKLTCPDDSVLVPVCMPLPLGISFEGKMVAEKYRIVVDEVVAGGNAAKADVKAGDILRACTAVFQVRGPLDEIGYFGNPPKNQNLPGVYVADGQSFDKTMNALQSNTAQVDGPGGRKQDVEQVCLVLQRGKA